MKIDELKGRLKSEYQVIPLDELVPADWNYKVDDAEKARKLAASVDAEKEALVLLVRELGDGKYEVVDGNHRLEALRGLGWEGAICLNYGEIPRARAAKISVAVNETRFDSDIVKLSKLFAGELIPNYGMDELEAQLPYSKDELEALASLHGGFPDAFDAAGAADFPEFDESVADSVEWNECPECGHKWPK